MILFKHASDLQKHLNQIRRNGLRSGFVPTMGALHRGHLSLVEQCRKQNDITVVSLFVNPLQFNNPEDFEKYPVTIDKDILLLEEVEADILFLPAKDEIYPEGVRSAVTYDLGELENILEGAFRPGHFQGVCKVMDRLMNIVQPDRLYLGQKDYQQVMVIRRLLGIIGNKAEIITAPIIREESGLAMSSRNQRLTDEERGRAASIYKALMWIKETQARVSFPVLKNRAIENLKSNGINTEYLELCKADDLSLLNGFNPDKKMVILIAAYLGDVRLIDNLIL